MQDCSYRNFRVVVIYFVIAIITSEVFLPTFYRLGISSTYEVSRRILFFKFHDPSAPDQL